MTGPWRRTYLGDVLTEAKPGFASGEDVADGVFQFRMNNVRTDGTLDLARKRRVPAKSKKIDSFFVRSGDVLFNATNSPELVGKSALVSGLDEPAVFSNHFIRLRSDPKSLTGKYLARWLQLQFAHRVFQARCKQWVNQATFSRDALLALEIPLPPVAEQRAIAAVLDQADEIRAKRRASLALLGRLSAARLQHLLGGPSSAGWSRVSLDDIGEVQGGLQVTHLRSENPLTVPYLRVANVYRGRLDLSEVKDMRVTAPELERTRLQPDDLLVVEGHGNPAEIGRVGRWSGEISNCVHQNHLIRVRIDARKADARFVEAYLNCPVGRQALLRAARTTSGLNTISTSDVRSATLPLPPHDVQARFGSGVEGVASTAKAQEAHLRWLDELFGSLQQRAFSGELSDAR